MNSKLNNIFKSSDIMQIDDSTKIVIMSDCHRGAGDNYDNFFKNRNIYDAALQYYFNNDFIYVELGDGDELWEVGDCKDIVDIYINTFKIIKKFSDNKRLIMIYGNHDIEKKSNEVLEYCFKNYFDNSTNKIEKLLENLDVNESLILKYYDCDIFLLHGHQVDILNGYLWFFSRFLVRKVWKFLEHLGVNDFTSVAKNNQVKSNVEKRLKKWSVDNNKIVIAGHTHRAVFPVVGDSLYFNDGSCVHPNGITCIEIKNGKISLIKWEYGVNKNGWIQVERKILESEKNIQDFFL